MTPQEMHIEVNQGLQKIASNIQANLKPEEIDWHLNKSQERYIKNHINQDTLNRGFQVDVKSLEDLQNVISTNIEIPIQAEATYSPSTPVIDMTRGLLPSNYMYPIQVRVKSAVLCADPGYVTTKGNKYEQVVVLPIVDDVTAPYYNQFKIVMNFSDLSTETIFEVTSTNKYAAYYGGLPSPKSKYIWRELVTENTVEEEPFLNSVTPTASPVTRLYWEKYEDIYYPDSVIIVKTKYSQSQLYQTKNFTSVVLSYGGVTVKTVTDTITNTRSVPIRTTASKIRKGRITNASIVDSVLHNPYHKSIADSPVITIANNGILTYYEPASFIVNSLFLDYIRKPRKINLALNRSCELSESTHQEICDQTVEYIKIALQDPTYKEKLEDNLTRME